jgi:hypothetical protein
MFYLVVPIIRRSFGEDLNLQIQLRDWFVYASLPFNPQNQKTLQPTKTKQNENSITLFHSRNRD